MEQLLLDKVKELVRPLLSGQQVELVDVLLRRERGRFTLKFLVDKPAGITLDECARLNREIDQVFDRENIIQQSYVLEVSSPGLDRPMKSTRDFQRAQGQLIRIILHEPLNKQNVWVGLVSGVDDEKVIIQTEDQKKQSIPRKNIARANLEVGV